eukprot:363576-Chlamydomonas_euryale.AAC.3
MINGSFQRAVATAAAAACGRLRSPGAFRFPERNGGVGRKVRHSICEGTAPQDAAPSSVALPS